MYAVVFEKCFFCISFCGWLGIKIHLLYSKTIIGLFLGVQPIPSFSLSLFPKVKLGNFDEHCIFTHLQLAECISWQHLSFVYMQANDVVLCFCPSKKKFSNISWKVGFNLPSPHHANLWSILHICKFSSRYASEVCVSYVVLCWFRFCQTVIWSLRQSISSFV